MTYGRNGRARTRRPIGRWLLVLVVATAAGWPGVRGGSGVAAAGIPEAASRPAVGVAEGSAELSPDAEQEEREALAARIADRVESLYRRAWLPLAVVCLLALGIFAMPRARRRARARAQPRGPRTPLLGLLLAGFGYFAFAAAGAFLAVGLGSVAGDYAAPVAALGGQAVALVALGWMLRAGLGMPFGAIGLGRERLGVVLGWSVVFYFAQLPGLLACMLAAGAIFPHQVQPQVLDIARHPEVFYRGLYLVAVVALAPVLEEVLFRGLVMHALRRLAGPALGVILSALLFAMVHTVEVYIPIFWLGLVLALAYHYTGSLAAPIAMHLLHNLGQFLMLLWAASGV